MKKLILLIAVLTLSLGVSAQDDAKKTTASKTTKVNYCCPKGDKCMTAAGKCEAHKCDMVKEGSYYCPMDMTQSDKAGKCSKCGMDLVQKK